MNGKVKVKNTIYRLLGPRTMSKKMPSPASKKAAERRKQIIGDSENDKHWTFDEMKHKHPKAKRELKNKIIKLVKR